MSIPVYPPGSIVGGVWIHRTSMEALLSRLAFWCRWWNLHPPKTVALVNAYSLVEAQRNRLHMEALTETDLCLADGVGVALLAGTPKIAGADLMLAAAKHPMLGQMRHVLLGGFGVAYRAALAQWKASEATALIRAPWIPETNLTDLVELANKVPCDILWVALGCPKQEIWMTENRNRLKAKVVIGVGAAFDFLAGRVPRAPKWMQPIGLEALYRIWAEPSRWRRQTDAAIGFLKLIVMYRREGLRSVFRRHQR